MDKQSFGFQDTLMYGRYTKSLAKEIKIEHEKLKRQPNFLNLEDEEKLNNNYVPSTRYQSTTVQIAAYLWRNTFAKLGEDWVFLALLGIIMAVLSFIMDRSIATCNNARIWLHRDLTEHLVAQYFAWISLPMFLILFSTGFVHLVAPQSIGSGIPEMKTILRGVALKEYLSLGTLIAKVVGLTATLGSGLPLGKEGPFVHIASIVATLLSKLVTSFKGIYENESRNTEMLAAACAVGVASCFAAPIGGVLFSIEVTTVYFAVRNYWRGFFAAVCGATVFRLLAVWFENADTVSAVFKTDFTMDYQFEPGELLLFAFIGVLSGLGGAFYVWLHRKYVTLIRSSRILNQFLQKHRFMYPALVTLLTTSVTFPFFLGQFMGAEMTTHNQVLSLFSNFPMTKSNLSVDEHEYVKYWLGSHPYKDVFINLVGFFLFTFIFSIICSTIPVPSGCFIPVFKIGAALGRIIGELMYISFPYGISKNSKISKISPGGYATVGSAAFSGAVTHTISVSVIVFEMTGQITLIIPMMISVLIANAIANLFAPSIYDSIILIKKLPYLPDLLPSSSKMYSMYVADFMSRDIKYVFKEDMTYANLKSVVSENKRFKSFPLVDRPDSMILLGSVQRNELIRLIEKQVGKERRLQACVALELEKKRRPSRFQVTPTLCNFMEQKVPEKYSSENQLTPKKSILKKQNSFTIKSSMNNIFSPSTSNINGYSTITGADNKMRQAFETIFQKSSQLKDLNSDKSQVKGSLPSISKRVQLPSERVCDMSDDEQKNWIIAELAKPIDFCNCQIDPAPFQLVEKTSLLKAHSIFSLLGIEYAYVTVIGKLVGIVGLKELRLAIEKANSGLISSNTDRIVVDEETILIQTKV